MIRGGKGLRFSSGQEKKSIDSEKRKQWPGSDKEKMKTFRIVSSGGPGGEGSGEGEAGVPIRKRRRKTGYAHPPRNSDHRTVGGGFFAGKK